MCPMDLRHPGRGNGLVVAPIEARALDASGGPLSSEGPAENLSHGGGHYLRTGIGDHTGEQAAPI